MLASPTNPSGTAARLVLLTGATGYVGGRLLAALAARGDWVVRCLARDPARLRVAAGNAQLHQGDVLEGMSLFHALAGVDTAYYLVHSLDSRADFERQDRIAAGIFGQAARQSGVRRIIYLSALGDDRQGLSAHVRSCQEVGRVLRDSGVECIELRAPIIIGRGSLAFEVCRALTDRLPIVPAPRWLATPTQPIAIDDALEYLTAALDLPAGESRVFEIGGPDVVTYQDVIREYARQRGLRRYVVPLPVMAPYLSSLWLSLVARNAARVSRRLIEGLRHPAVVRDARALASFGIRPMGVAAAIELALTARS